MRSVNNYYLWLKLELKNVIDEVELSINGYFWLVVIFVDPVECFVKKIY